MATPQLLSKTCDPADIINEVEDDSFGILERPKRPLSAYNLFFRDEREKLLRSLPSREAPSTEKSKQKRDRTKCHRKIDFSNLAKTIASRWKQVDESIKKEYEDVANAGRIVYNEKAKAWREQRKALGLSTKREMKKKPAPSNLSNKVKREVAPPSNALQDDSKTKLDLGPNPRIAWDDPRHQLLSLPCYRPPQGDYFGEVRTASAEPVTAFPTYDESPEEPLDPFEDSIPVPSMFSYGQQRLSNAQVDLPYSCHRGWTPIQKEPVMSVYDPSLSISAYAPMPKTSFNKVYHPQLGYKAPWGSVLTGVANGSAQVPYSPQQASHANIQYQDDYSTTQPVNAFDE